ncbi:MAG: hypothetical protein PHW82_10475 [Bacteroidales bacterium]|nr:hypothetical protein [Bacteroidales bacterium]
MTAIYLFGISTTSIRVKCFIEYHKLYTVKAFIVDDEYKTHNNFEGYPIISLSDFKNIHDYQKLQVFICVAWNRLNEDRKFVFQRLSAEKLNIINLISPNAIIRGEVLGSNVFVGDYVILEVGTVINQNIFIDHNSFVGTNTIIKEHAYIGAKSVIAGDSIIGQQSFIGIHSTVFDKVCIGSKCIISGGEIIKRNVQDFSVVKNVDGRQITKTYTPEEIINKLIVKRSVR